MIPERPVHVLVVGSGGREHALCWKLAQSPHRGRIFCAPGNGGTATMGDTINVPVGVMEFDKLIEFCQIEEIDLVVVGPDNPLAEGIVDAMQEAGLRVFGPRKQAARLESSKAYAKEFMTEYGIPTARFAICDSLDEASDCVAKNPWARVIKVDGLALGKGVYVLDDEKECMEALAEIFSARRFGDSGNRVVIEERLAGVEISLLALCDGKSLAPLLPSQDHKRRFDEDRGPNTGGMGAYAPVEAYGRCRQAVETQVLEPIRRALAGGFDYTGVLYVGLMVADIASATPRPYVLEFNARFGDPETQALLPLMASDLLVHLWACTEGQLAESKITWSNGASCCVVATASTYPDKPSRGERVEIGALPAGVVVFHAGTGLLGGLPVTDGGRILSVTGTGSDLLLARKQAYRALETITFAGMDYRKDIAEGAVATCQSS